MSKVLLVDILWELKPYFVVLISLVTGMLIANRYWKDRIYRYANSEIQQTLAYQAKKISDLETTLKIKNKEIEENKAKVVFARTEAIRVMDTMGKSK